MKKLIFILLILSLLCGCTPQNEKITVDEEKINGAWIYYSELSMKNENGGTEEQFREKTEEIFENCRKMGINTVFYHVRPFGDSFYPSEIFPWTAYLTGIQGKSVSYDPLEIAIEIAHKNEISLHAWINPFRIAASEDVSLLSEDNPALKWINEKSPNVVNVNNGYYYSPASPDAQALIIDGVREILNNYDVDGIHIDDYFYPSTDESVDEYFYKQYKENGGEEKLKNWRLSTVSAFVSELYNTVKSYDEACIFSISPAGNIKNNYDEQYADVRLWMSESGYADWIIPQLYYGYENEILPFDNACDAWAGMEKSDDVKLLIGIAAYKVNNGEDEWAAGNGIISKQLNYIYTKSNVSGAVFFSYSSLVDESKAEEFSNLSEKALSQLSS